MTVSEWRDWYRAAPGFWFRPKRYGWGVVPVTWQGWAFTAAFLLVAGGVQRLADLRGPWWQLLFVPLIPAALWLCYRKTDGGWRWRWGGE
jgi:hypothetical protein